MISTLRMNRKGKRRKHFSTYGRFYYRDWWQEKLYTFNPYSIKVKNTIDWLKGLPQLQTSSFGG